jgi:DNA-binding XRE family transcriptional regulator/predicted RNase H-like HicB family nuclease
MYYLAKVSREGKFWLAEFPDAPGCQTFAESRAALDTMARDALDGWLRSWLVTGETPPVPKGKRVTGDSLRVTVSPDLATAMQLRWAREAAKLTQAELAKRAGVSQQQIAKLEKPGENPTIGTLAKIAKALGRNVDVIFSAA